MLPVFNILSAFYFLLRRSSMHNELSSLYVYTRGRIYWYEDGAVVVYFQACDQAYALEEGLVVLDVNCLLLSHLRILNSLFIDF